MASSIANLGGYDCDFVEPPPDELLCLICTFVAKEPMQMDCCGKVYCKACLIELKKRSNNCPQCRKEGNGFTDRRSERNVKALKVKCDNLKNDCNWTGELASLNEHLDTCPFEAILCKYSKIGCEEKLLGKELKDHEKDNQLHLQLAIDTILKQGDINSQAQNRFGKIEDKLIHAHTAANSKTTFKISEFNECKRSEKAFYSPPFYTHQGGYKMFIRVDANGADDGEGTHVSVSACLLRGDNDDNLTWPFTGTVTVELLNQLEDKRHRKMAIRYPEGKEDEYNMRVLDGERSQVGLGKIQFISHEALNYNWLLKRQYLKDDCLYFRISVKTTSLNPKPWLTPTI